MLNEYFKQTMNHFGIKGTELSKRFGCGSGYISDIRTGKCNPPIDRFWELITVMDEIAPGAKRYFGNLIAENYDRVSPEDLAVSIEPEELVALMSNEQLSKLMLAIANRIGNIDKKLKKDDQLLLVS
jgi:predicted transcriptional regulator